MKYTPEYEWVVVEFEPEDWKHGKARFYQNEIKVVAPDDHHNETSSRWLVHNDYINNLNNMHKKYIDSDGIDTDTLSELFKAKYGI